MQRRSAKNLGAVTDMDWDKLRIFHAAAEAGSFTHAGEFLGMSQSAVSRQVSSLEKDLKVPLFHRHARGLILTEQGELLYRTAHEVSNRLESAKTLLSDTKEKPFGDLRLTTTVGLGSTWLTPRLKEFVDLYPDIDLELVLSDVELNLSMREADVAIWFGEPSQPDLIRRPLFTVHFHVYAASNYVRRHGSPSDLSELKDHRIITYGNNAPDPIRGVNWLETAGRDDKSDLRPPIRISNLYAMKLAVLSEMGIAVLPDYMMVEEDDIVPVLSETEVPSMPTFFVYPEELRNSKRVNVFRDFIVKKAREWSF